MKLQATFQPPANYPLQVTFQLQANLSQGQSQLAAEPQAEVPVPVRPQAAAAE